ncbi:MAG TPA: RT0821/Lpp0805 family surface protein [Thermodesulfobacteriota bacterium]|jgi:surface antigen
MDKLTFWGRMFLSLSLFCLALSLAYVAYEIGKTRTEAPQLLDQVGKTSEKLAPIVKEAAKIRQAIPPILDQVEATRNEIPAIRSTIDNVSAAAQAITKEVGEVRVIMPDILAELQKTREALPGILQQADQVASKAQTVAKESGKKAAGGVIEGIVASPFTIAGDLSRSITSSLELKDTKGLAREDFELIRANVLVILEDEEIGSTTTWENPEEKNRGTATLIRQFEKNGMSCKEIQITIWAQDKKKHDSRHTMCRQKDGTWIDTKGKIF